MLSRRAAWALTALAFVVIGAYVVWPSLATFGLGLRAEPLERLFGGGMEAPGWRGLLNSVLVSLGTVVLGGALGVGVAYGTFRFDFPFRRALAALAPLPLALPPLVGVLAFVFLYGESGMLPRGLQQTFGLEEVPFSLAGVWGVLTVHVYAFYVYSYLFARAALASLDRSLLDASADLGASEWATLRHVVLPALKPALVGAALLAFMLSMASFTAPLLFAADEPFLTTQIYQYKLSGRLAEAAAVGAVLTGICLLFLMLLEMGPGGGALAAGQKGGGRGVRHRPGRFGRIALGAVAAAVLLFVGLPVATVVLLSFVEDGTWTVQAVPDTFTLANYGALVSQADVVRPILNSLWMAAAATAANVAFGVATAVAIARGGVPGVGLLRGLALLPFAIPGTVIALNLIVAFDEPSALAGGAVLVGTAALLPLAYFVRHIPLVVRSTMAALERYDDRLTEASLDLGADRTGTFRRVVLPVLAPGIVAGGLLTLVAALGEFVASILLYTVSNRPISVELFAQLRQYDLGAAAAYGVVLMALVGAATAVAGRLGNPA
jgi:iron(III) transport system permease protein